MHMETSELINAWVAAGNKITSCPTGRMSADLRYTRFSAYGRTMKVATRGRQYNRNCVRVAGSTGNKITA